MTSGSLTHEAGQPGGMRWGGSWEGVSGWRGHRYTYGQLIQMDGKNHHYIAIILQLKQIIFFKPIMFRIQNSERLDFSQWRRCYVTIPHTKGTPEVSHLCGELFTFSCVRVHISLG